MSGYTVKNGKIVKGDKSEDGKKFPALNISLDTANSILEIAKHEGIEPENSTKGEGKGKPSPSSVKAIVHGVINGVLTSFIGQKIQAIQAAEKGPKK